MLFIEGVDPFMRVDALDDATLGRLVNRARAVLQANRISAIRVPTGPAGGGPPDAPPSPRPGARGSRLWVHGRAGRPCRRCGGAIRARRRGELPRTTYSCDRCQPARTADEGAR